MNEDVCLDLLADYQHDIGANLEWKDIKRLVIAVYYGREVHWCE